MENRREVERILLKCYREQFHEMFDLEKALEVTHDNLDRSVLFNKLSVIYKSLADISAELRDKMKPTNDTRR